MLHLATSSSWQWVNKFVFITAQVYSPSCCYCSVAKPCLSHCKPMDCSMPGIHDLHYLLEFAQTHVHCVHDAIQPSHPLLTPSSPAFNLSQHQGLFQWISSSNQVAKGLKLQLQSFQWIFRVDSLQDWLIGSPCSSRDSQESSPAPHFESINSLALCLLCGPNLTAVHDQVHEILTKKKLFLKQKIPLRPFSQWLFPIGTVKIGF